MAFSIMALSENSSAAKLASRSCLKCVGVKQKCDIILLDFPDSFSFRVFGFEFSDSPIMGQSEKTIARGTRENASGKPGRISSLSAVKSALRGFFRAILGKGVELSDSRQMTWKENGERDLETDVSVAVLRIASEQSDRIASHELLRLAVPGFVVWDKEMAKSRSVLSDKYWEQLISNICKNRMAPGNILREGYATHHPQFGFRITNDGREFLRSKGFKVY